LLKKRYRSMIRFKSYILLTGLFLMVALACKKDSRPYFPNVSFEQYVYLSNPSSFPLTAPGGSIYTDGGYRGLIIYRRTGGITAHDFAAFDRGCPEHYEEDCGYLDVSEDGLYAQCRCEGELYLLMDGSPAGEASIPLRNYPISINSNVLRISN